MKPLHPHPQRGFTLIELMIVVAIVAILSSIAIPSYQSYIAKAQRSEARSILMQAANYVTRFYAANDRYDSSRGGTDLALPDAIRYSPSGATAATALYQIKYAGSKVSGVNSNDFTLTMERVAGSRAANDECGDFTLSNLGVKDIVNARSGQTWQQCWR